MARVVADRALLEPGRAPHMCALTGGPVDCLVEVRFARVPAWTWVLLPFGIVPFLIASQFAREEVVGVLPYAQPVVDRYRARNRTLLIVVAGAVVALLGAAAISDGLLGLLGIGGLLAALVLLVLRERGFVRGSPLIGGRAVRLDGLHPDFAAAVDPRLRVDVTRASP